MLITMCSAIFFRITPIFSMRTLSPGWNAGGGGAIGARAPRPAAGAPDVFLPPAMNALMSSLVTRPEIPVPFNCEMSMPCSLAILRTRGEERTRRRSSSVAGEEDAEVTVGGTGAEAAEEAAAGESEDAGT